MKLWSLISVFSLVVFAAGCVQINQIDPQDRIIADVYTVHPQITWSGIKEGKNEIWTVDGANLQAVRFVKGLKDGDTLFKPKPKQELPKFHKDMRAHGVMDFIVDSMDAIGLKQIQTKNLRPIKFGALPGHRFDFTCLTEDGLEMEGFVVGSSIKEHVHLIFYYGARQYYFAKHVEHAEKLIKSIRVR